VPTISITDPATPLSGDAVVVGVVPGERGPRLAPGAKPVEAAMGRRLIGALRALGATGAQDEVLRIPTLGLAPFPLVLATGLGDEPRAAESIRRAVGAAVRSMDSQSSAHIAIDGDTGAIAEGALLGSYRYTAYKSRAGKPALRRITVAAREAGRAELTRAKVVAEAVTRTRDLVNTPPNVLYPETLAARAVEFAEAAGLQVEVLDERALRRNRFGAVLAVGSGSARPPRLVRISYRPRRAKAHVALVGKGITFDSGGLNIKTSEMDWMKSDMGGAAAVVTGICAIAALRLPVEVTATVPMAENMPGGSAYRPSDVITMRNGRTVEVSNTDAEGRLVLADAIARACEDEPDYLIEASTLTGAQLISLGNRVIGAMGEPRWRDRVSAAANAAGESVWAMPLPEDLRRGLDSSVADLQNHPGDRWGGMLVGGHFLADFMPDGLPWVHLDIAGPAFNRATAYGYTPLGGTGAGVRTIIAAVENLSAG
jgi:leucyl aminopeptidase